MSSTTDKIKGYTNEAAGTAKKGVGEALNDDKMRVEGAAQKAQGEAEVAVGKTKDAVKSVIDKA